VCGSPVFGELRGHADARPLRLGLLDDDPASRPAYHWAVEFKAPWWTIRDDAAAARDVLTPVTARTPLAG
jgi:hypothetical protein